MSYIQNPNGYINRYMKLCHECNMDSVSTIANMQQVVIPSLKNELEALKILEENYSTDGELSFISKEVDMIEKAIQTL